MKSPASLAQVSVFVRIAELGSLSAAARDLHLTPSAVSKSLAQLEQRLGVLLIKRTTRTLTLTEAGRAVFDRATTLLADVENTLDAARQHQRPEGMLRVTSSMAFGARQLPGLMAGYLRAHPLVDAHIALDDRFVNLAEENYDVAIRITGGTDWGYAARRLATIRWLYCAAPAYLEKYGPISRPQELGERGCLVYPAMTLSGQWVFSGPDIVHVAVKPRLVSNSSLALREATLDGLGVACLPAYLVADDIAQGRLVIVAPAYTCAITHDLYAMYFRSRYINPVVRSFVDYLAETLQGGPSWEATLAGVGLAAPA